MAIKSIKEARKVEQADLRVGDKVYVVNNEPEVVENVKLRDGRFETDLDYHRPENVTIYLAERILPDLPNKTGSVILTKLDEATAPWMLGHAARWISPNGTAMTSVQLRAHMEKFGLTFEVIA